MRTTIHLDDDIIAEVRDYAEQRKIGVGKAVSDLVRRSLTMAHPTKMVNGLIVFDLPPNSPRVTSKHVKELENEI